MQFMKGQLNLYVGGWVCVCVCVSVKTFRCNPLCNRYIYIYAFRYIYIYAFIQSDLHCIQVTVSTFYQLLLSLGNEPMILALLAPYSTIWATGKLYKR